MAGPAPRWRETFIVGHLAAHSSRGKPLQARTADPEWVLPPREKAEGKEGAVALFERRARMGDREVVYRDRRGPVRRVLGAITSFIGWIVLLVIALIVLLILIL
jgi:hypothetical protein